MEQFFRQVRAFVVRASPGAAKAALLHSIISPTDNKNPNSTKQPPISLVKPREAQKQLANLH